MDGWGDSGHLNRCENERLDAGWVADRWVDPTSVLLAVDDSGRISVNPTGTGLSERTPSGSFESQRHFLLGISRGRAIFVEAAGSEPAAGLRELMPRVGEADREVAVAAVALINWHATSPHCGRCGALTDVTSAGLVRHCPACGRDRFPRSDPAIIVAIVDAEDRLLLGHQAVWPTGRMSILAGFVSAGESLEQAVHREVLEESGLQLSAVRYLGSQPWPFPRSLMLGFVARAAGSRIKVDGIEIEHARWFSRDDLTAAEAAEEVGLPGSASIAQRIIGHWRDGTLPAPEA